MVLFGIDTGGTFTDFVYKIGEDRYVRKILSTPENPGRAVLAGLSDVDDQDNTTIVHGTTVATNTLLEGKGAKTALITNQGFEDVIEIGRQNRDQLYSLEWQPTPALIPKKRRFGVAGRIDSAGIIIEDLDESQIRDLIKTFKQDNVESIVVAFLFSFTNGAHEDRVRSILSQTDIPISLSHEILSEFREYERISTTAVNAYVSPRLANYLDTLIQAVGADRLRVMQSNGGSISARTAGREAVRTILSGPAGGVVGAYEIGKKASYNKLITFDMGGTSTDVALIDETIPLATESKIGGCPIKVPMIDIHTVGAGGGSIARIDAGGALTVGPQSAGADPGPICFGKGAHLTVTDANLFLGRLIPDDFLGGAMSLHVERLKEVIHVMAAKSGMPAIALAEGILAVANTKMMRAVRAISVERGFDPSAFTLFSFGGAGGLHAAFLAGMLKMSTVCIPKNPGLLSAMGMLLADIVKDYSKTVMLNGAPDVQAIINGHFRPMIEQAYQDMGREGLALESVLLSKSLDMRYKGQSFEISVPFSEQCEADFHTCHQKAYGYCNPQRETEIVTIRLRAHGAREKPRIHKSENMHPDAGISVAFKHFQQVVFESNPFQTPVYQREKLMSGHRIEGPAIIVEYSSTIVVPPWASAEIDAFENVIIKM